MAETHPELCSGTRGLAVGKVSIPSSNPKCGVVNSWWVSKPNDLNPMREVSTGTNHGSHATDLTNHVVSLPGVPLGRTIENTINGGHAPNIYHRLQIRVALVLSAGMQSMDQLTGTHRQVSPAHSPS